VGHSPVSGDAEIKIASTVKLSALAVLMDYIAFLMEIAVKEQRQ
jgi:hypothetical protein